MEKVRKANYKWEASEAGRIEKMMDLYDRRQETLRKALGDLESSISEFKRELDAYENSFEDFNTRLHDLY